MRDIERMHSTIFDIFLTEAKIYQMFPMAKCYTKCQIHVGELISCPCRLHFTSSCLLIKFYGLISLCKVVVAFKTLNEKDKLNTLHRVGRGAGFNWDNLYPSQVKYQDQYLNDKPLYPISKSLKSPLSYASYDQFKCELWRWRKNYVRNSSRI